MRTHSRRRWGLAAFGGMLAILLVLGFGATAHAGDDEDEDTFEQKIIKKFLGGLGVDVGGNGIEYRERSPLVIPPTRDLPPPEAADTVKHPAWPKDPDAKISKKKARTPADSVADYNRQNAPHLDDMRRGAISGGTGASNPQRNPIDNTSEHGGRPLSPEQLGTKGLFGWSMFSKKQEQAEFTGEPDRTSLTQPPPGYQTPSPDYPYGLSGQGPNTPTRELPQIKDPRAEGATPR